ncbi:MAG: DUF1631 family protein [Pseudomonadota bacterium]
MDTQELFGYLRNVDSDRHYPMEGVLAQTEAIGDPALPPASQRAALSWLDNALKQWDSQFAPEEPLAGELRRLRPLLAALAVKDRDFFIPGKHPLHQLMDAAQVYSVGWHAELGRAGQNVESDIKQAVAAALRWFDSTSTDLGAISKRMQASAGKAAARVEKMTRRLIETERGRTRIAQSKRQAAQMINAAMAQDHMPVGVGEFLKGPWYDSAQLVLSKYGEQSDEWQQVTLTTNQLLQSVRVEAGKGSNSTVGRPELVNLVAELPKRIVRWLLSLQHDEGAAREALDAIEQVHTSLLRGEPIQRQAIPPIPVASPSQTDPAIAKSLLGIEEGQWLSVPFEKGQPVRVMLALRMNEQQQLLFTNHAGLKVAQLSFEAFAKLRAVGDAIQLDSGASLSRCLSSAVGLVTQDDLDEFTGVAAQRARERRLAEEEAERERLLQEQRQLEREAADQERARREEEERRQAQAEREEAERLRREKEEAEQRRREETELDKARLEQEREEAKEHQQRWLTLTTGFVKSTEEAPPQIDDNLEEELQVDYESPAAIIPRYAWLGFRDEGEDEIVLARLAVHLQESDTYVFVNRLGERVRELSGDELVIVLTRGLIDIVESRARFAEDLARFTN